MIYYDSNFKPVEISITEKLSHQYNSHYVYKTADGRCLKVFRVYDVRPDLELEKKIQSMQLENYYTVDDYLFNESGEYSAFLMPFYESCNDDILQKPSDYISDNFISIFSSFSQLARNRIETRDANHENIIFTEDRIIVIDDERYTENQEDSIEAIRRSNHTDAVWILYWTLIKAANRHQEFTDTDFYNFFATTEPNGQELCHTISQYKYPIEYLRKVKTKIATK